MRDRPLCAELFAFRKAHTLTQTTLRLGLCCCLLWRAARYTETLQIAYTIAAMRAGKANSTQHTHTHTPTPA